MPSSSQLNDLLHSRHLNRARWEDYEFLRSSGVDHERACRRVGLKDESVRLHYARLGVPVPGGS
ncbi:hypothetical protein ASF35_16510 [Aeromicrobium sp. Leaf291]|nr:hypothetical protein ASF35_16510 [Aeromicrobium sp. Leaf291]